MTQNFASALRAITKDAPEEGRQAAINGAISVLQDNEKTELRKALQLNNPDKKTNNAVWLIVIGAFAIVLVAVTIFLGLGYFMAPAKDGVKAETLLVVFTTTAAFLAGLFAPSPVGK